MSDVVFFPSIGNIPYEGPQSKNPLSFKWYNATQETGGKSMKDHLRFAVAYWHSFCGSGADPFGRGTRVFPWDDVSDPLDRAKIRMDYAFEFISKMGIPFYCFHDFMFDDFFRQ